MGPAELVKLYCSYGANKVTPQIRLKFNFFDRMKNYEKLKKNIENLSWLEGYIYHRSKQLNKNNLEMLSQVWEIVLQTFGENLKYLRPIYFQYFLFGVWTPYEELCITFTSY